MDPQASAALERLDAGALADIFDQTPGRVEYPVVQCLQIKPVAAQATAPPGAEHDTEPKAPDRYRVIFSDSRNYVQTMLATTANHYVQSDLLKRGVLVQLTVYQANAVKGKR